MELICNIGYVINGQKHKHLVNGLIGVLLLYAFGFQFMLSEHQRISLKLNFIDIRFIVYGGYFILFVSAFT